MALSIFAISGVPIKIHATPSFEEEDSFQLGLGQKTAVISPNGDVSIAWNANPSGDHFATIDDTQREPTLQDVSNFISTSVADTSDIFGMTTITDAVVVSKIEFWGLVEGSSEDIGISLDFGEGYGAEEEIGRASCRERV